MRRELTFRLIGKFSVPGRAIFLLTRRRVFHFARLRNQVKNSSSALVGAYVSFVSICLAVDFSACARVRVFRTENEPYTFGNERWSVILLFVGRSFFNEYRPRGIDEHEYRRGNNRELTATDKEKKFSLWIISFLTSK